MAVPDIYGVHSMQGFTALYQRYAADVRRFALFLSGSASDADDITAETFARALTGREIEHGTVKGYLFTIARNVYLKGRALRLRDVEVDDSLRDRGTSPEQNLSIKESQRALLSALAKLPESDRAALLMRGDDEMSHQEIAVALGISVVAAKVRIHRARIRLAMLMDTSGGSDESNA